MTTSPNTPTPDAFGQFINALSADCRLGRFVRPLAGQSPEAIILNLAQALATASEGQQPHPVLQTLEELDNDTNLKGTPNEYR